MIKEILLLKNFYDNITKKELNNWTLSNYSNSDIFGDSNNNPPKTSYTTRHLNKNFIWPTAAIKLQKKLINYLNLSDYRLRFDHGIVNTVNYPGCLVYSHKDTGDKIPGYVTYHCNCVTKKPLGGETVIEGVTYDLEENDVLCYAVSELEHMVNTIQGQKLRILWSFCFYIPNKYFSDYELYNSIRSQQNS